MMNNTIEQADITTANRGDIVRFKSYALRVEAEPIRNKGSIRLSGRKSTDGCPTVSKWFLSGMVVEIERNGAPEYAR